MEHTVLAYMFVGRECDHDAGFTDSEKVAISRALDIDSRLCECELYCFATNCKVARGEQVVQRSDIVKAWDSIPRTFKQSSREDHADSCCPLVMLFGASPRSSTKLLNGTHVHPQLLDMLVSFVRHHAPQFFFTTIALRLDSRKPPHRDIRNGPFGTFFQVLTEISQGGGLWIADASGRSFRQHNGRSLPGISFQAQESPVIFDARRRLHATEPWTGEPRLVVIAWTVIHFGTLDTPIKSELRERRFPLPGDETPRVFECSLLTPLQPTPCSGHSDPDPDPKKRRTELQALFHTASAVPGIAIDGKTMVFHID